MAPIEASHLCRQLGYSVHLLSARGTERPEPQWIVNRPTDWPNPLPRGGRFTASQLVAFAAALP